MHTNLYLVEQLDRQHRQQFVAQAARNRSVAQISNMKMTRSQTMKRLKLIAAAVLVAVTLVGATPHALIAYDGSVPAVASMCCWGK